jgi:replication factor C large subunit
MIRKLDTYFDKGSSEERGPPKTVERMQELWTEKYCPKKVSEIVGHGKPIEEMLDWARDFKKSGKRAVLLHGPTGNGKTCSVYAIANELDYEVIETNASDFRTKGAIQQQIGHAARHSSLLGKKGKILLVDEVDGIHGNSDRGGVPALVEIIKETSFPIILTANDPWKQSLRSLRNYCRLVQLRKVDVRASTKFLGWIAEKENVKVNEEVLHEIANRSEGDLRAAVSDLQALANGRERIEKEDLETIRVRSKEVAIFETLMTIFKSKDKFRILDAFRNSDKTPDEIFQWLAENIAHEYEDADEVAKAYDYLSRADLYRGRIRHNMAWGLQSYANELMALGVANSKKEKYSKFTKYRPPGIIIKMGGTKGSRAMRDAVALKVGNVCHCSKKDAISQFPYFSIIMKKNEIDFGLGDEELDYLKKF